MSLVKEDAPQKHRLKLKARALKTEDFVQTLLRIKITGLFYDQEK